MIDRKEMIDFALMRMAGFTLEGSSDGDNRSIFGLVKTLIQSASGDSIAECRKPLATVLSIRVRDPREKFLGCKLTLLCQTIVTLFGGFDNLLTDKAFTGDKHIKPREYLLEYLEVCRRIFVAKYASTTPLNSTSSTSMASKPETTFEIAFRIAQERNIGRGDT